MFKLRWIRTGLGALALIGVATVATDQFSAFKIRRLESRITELDREKAELQLYAERLGGSRRVAQVNVVEQFHDDDGEPITILHWQQIGPSGGEDFLAMPVDFSAVSLETLDPVFDLDVSLESFVDAGLDA